MVNFIRFVKVQDLNVVRVFDNDSKSTTRSFKLVNYFLGEMKATFLYNEPPVFELKVHFAKNS